MVLPGYYVRNWVPEDYGPSGEVGPDIVVWDHVLKEVLRHAASDLTNEVAGFLLGHALALPDQPDPVIVVEAAVTAKHVNSTPSRIELTHDTWTAFHNERETAFEDMAVIGWYHTHPGWGIFLSPYDTFIHENFFNKTYHIALVIDPVQDRSGLFKWVAGELDPSRYYGFAELSTLRQQGRHPGVNLLLARPPFPEDSRVPGPTEEEEPLAATRPGPVAPWRGLRATVADILAVAADRVARLWRDLSVRLRDALVVAVDRAARLWRDLSIRLRVAQARVPEARLRSAIRRVRGRTGRSRPSGLSETTHPTSSSTAPTATGGSTDEPPPSVVSFKQVDI